IPIADWLAIAIAIALPWSTSATSVLIVLWLIAVAPTLDFGELRATLMTPAGGLPVLLVLLAVAGMLWAGVPLKERLQGFASFSKLLVIPVLFQHFRRSDKGLWVFGGFLISCVILLIASTLLFTPLFEESTRQIFPGTPVKNPATQSEEFAICISVLLFIAF